MQFLKARKGVESTELMGIIAVFVVAIVIAFRAFGDAAAAFVNSLPSKLGFH